MVVITVFARVTLHRESKTARHSLARNFVRRAIGYLLYFNDDFIGNESVPIQLAQCRAGSLRWPFPMLKC